MAYTPIAILAVIFVLTALRQVGGLRLKIWQIMAGGAVAALLTGSIAPMDALRAIDLDVIVFLFGMFVVGEALVESGYLHHLSFEIFKKVKSTGGLLLAVMLVMGVLSVFLMNDTVAVIGTPLVLYFASMHRMPGKPLLLALCFAVTIGSVASPIGNPQNLLIALSGGLADPFLTFFKYLAAPTIVNILIACWVLKAFYGVDFHTDELRPVKDEVKDKALARLAKASLAIVFALVGVKVVSVYAGFDFRLTYIAVAAAMPILIFSNRRWHVASRIDWHTLVFFAALFVVMESVWRSGAIQGGLRSAGFDPASPGFIIASGVTISQFLSNVPFVALFLPVLKGAGVTEAGLMALAAGSTIAGNLLIFGAASNVIVIQAAERRGHTLSFAEFAKAGIPVTALNALVYWIYIAFIV